MIIIRIPGCKTNHKSCVHCVDEILTDPLMFGSLVVSILPTSHVIILVTGSKEYFP